MLFSQGLHSLFVYYFYIGKGAETMSFLPVITVAFFFDCRGCYRFLVTKIARGLGKVSTFIVTGLIVLVTIANIILNIAAEPLWHKLTVIFVLAPAVILGNWLIKMKEGER
ncbi:MAG: hypothetical protein HC846_11490 [Blastocatellia bacterium]|nr:hypothetical protein [Blastocatellia bacterium]